MQRAGDVDLNKLIGKSVTNARNERIGEIESVIVDSSGSVRAVVVGVGGFLGIGERDVAVTWESLTLSPDRDKVSLNTTSDDLRNMPEYTYQDRARRRTVFADQHYDRRDTATMPRTTTGEADDLLPSGCRITPRPHAAADDDHAARLQPEGLHRARAPGW